MMATALPFYRRLEENWGIVCDIQQPVFRRFAAVEEQNAWFEAADRPGLSHYLIPKVFPNTNSVLHAPFGLGQVKDTGRIATRILLEAFQADLQRRDALDTRSFDYAKLRFENNILVYEELQARHVIFCEGFGMHSNPFFNYLPLQGTKGELLTIYAPELKESRIIKSGVFFIPLGNDRYRVGATYSWNDYTQEPTQKGRESLLSQLRQIVTCPFTVEEQVAGIRPTVPDRRPLIGQHPEKRGLYVLNGLGSRGVLIAPYAAQCLAAFILNDVPIPSQMDISRYTKYLGKP
jgi:glycine/D-amino acid oxidase-like deaminating enzyme